MPAGGYKVYDCKNLELAYNGTTMPDLYNFIESSHGKPILLKNLSLSGTYISAVYTAFRSVLGVYLSPLTFNSTGNADLKIGVTQDDLVYVTTTVNPIPPVDGDAPDMGGDGPSASM